MQNEATLHRPARTKVKRGKRPDGVAYDNKNMPADCEGEIYVIRKCTDTTFPM